MRGTLGRRLAAEFAGTALLLAAVVGSGIMAERLAQGNVALALLANALTTGAALTALILALSPVSGGHFNPAVTLADGFWGGTPWQMVPGYVFAQIAGAVSGVAAAHVMFGLPLFAPSRHVRSGGALLFSEVLATAGLLVVIAGCSRKNSAAAPYAVGAYITSAYWFTASTSFANPAVTLARCFTDTFAGIRPADAPGFILAQLIATALVLPLIRWLFSTAEFTGPVRSSTSGS
jgi:glycerol uptake facilitator-like aquaporin